MSYVPNTDAEDFYLFYFFSIRHSTCYDEHTLGMNETEWISFWWANLLSSRDQLLSYRYRRYRRRTHLIFRFTVYTRKKWEHSTVHWISLVHSDRRKKKKVRIMSYRYIWKVMVYAPVQTIQTTAMKMITKYYVIFTST